MSFLPDTLPWSLSTTSVIQDELHTRDGHGDGGEFFGHCGRRGRSNIRDCAGSGCRRCGSLYHYSLLPPLWSFASFLHFLRSLPSTTSFHHFRPSLFSLTSFPHILPSFLPCRCFRHTLPSLPSFRPSLTSFLHFSNPPHPHPHPPPSFPSEGQGSHGRNLCIPFACVTCAALHSELPQELAEVLPKPDQQFCETAIAKLFPGASREGIKDEGELRDAVQAVYLQLAATVDLLSGMGVWDSLSKELGGNVARASGIHRF